MKRIHLGLGFLGALLPAVQFAGEIADLAFLIGTQGFGGKADRGPYSDLTLLAIAFACVLPDGRSQPVKMLRKHQIDLMVAQV